MESEEVVYASTGSFPVDRRGSANASTLRIRYREPDYRKIEAMLRISRDDQLELLKSLVARGLLAEAEELLASMDGAEPAGSELKTELIVQRARIHYLSGRWAESIRACNLLESVAELPPLSRMCLHQIRANALFELGEFQKSLLDCERLYGFQALFPHGQLPIYSQANHVRLLLRMAGPEAAAEAEKKMWRKWAESLPSRNLDPLLTLLRSRLERNRFSRLPYGATALACGAIARRLGDGLYEGLACLDLFVANGASSADGATVNRLELFASQHPWIRQRREEIFSDRADVSETARRARESLIGAAETAGAPGFAAVERIQSIVLSESGAIADLSAATVARLSLQNQGVRILRALAHGSIPKERLFKEVWNLRFSMERHDSVIRIALHRLREQTGISVRSEQRQLSLPDTLLVVDA